MESKAKLLASLSQCSLNLSGYSSFLTLSTFKIGCLNMLNVFLVKQHCEGNIVDSLHQEKTSHKHGCV